MRKQDRYPGHHGFLHEWGIIYLYMIRLNSFSLFINTKDRSICNDIPCRESSGEI